MRRVRLALAIVVTTIVACDAPAPQSRPPASPPPTRSAAPSTIPSPSPSPSSAIEVQTPPGFVDLATADPTILHDIRYFTEHNFVGRRIDGYLAPRCLLTEQAAQALRRAQAAAATKGYSLKVYDCYRPLRAGEDFKRWAATPDDAMRAEFFPNLGKREVFAQGYVSSGRSPHSRGSTVDLTIVALPAREQRPFVPGEPLTPCTASADRRFPDNTIDMGTGYDCFDSRSHTLDPRITGAPRQNRLLLRQLLTDAGFRNYANEWWHYSLVNEPFPGTYFDFPVAAR